jgi:hypothetical protein
VTALSGEASVIVPATRSGSSRFGVNRYVDENSFNDRWDGAKRPTVSFRDRRR